VGNKIVAIVGSYRKDGTIDTAVEAILAAAREKGAATHTIYLTEQHIEFCRNCRICMQTPGPERGKCPQQDDLDPILQEIEAADAVVLGSPVNCGNVTAIFRRFMERLVGCGYWPWGKPAPSPRSKALPRKAALVTSSAMPGVMVPIFTGTMTALRMAAKMLGARPVGSVCIGLAAGEVHHRLPARKLARARRIGLKLA
jgi:multimeric flavodoxin WrbA